LLNNTKFTYDLKKNIVSLKNIGFDTSNNQIDILLAAYLLEYNVKDDIDYLALELGSNVNCEDIKASTVLKAKLIYDCKDDLIDKLNKKGMLDLFNNIEMPLSIVLADMEYTGFTVSEDILKEQGIDIKNRIDEVTLEIHNMCGEEFNISSPSQLGTILFEKLNLPHGKKTKTGYSYHFLRQEKDSQWTQKGGCGGTVSSISNRNMSIGTKIDVAGLDNFVVQKFYKVKMETTDDQ
jgi:DNA polymerase-1